MTHDSCPLTHVSHASTISSMDDTAVPKPTKILLVEDDDALASTYLTRLQAEGFDIRRVANGEEALAAAKDYKPNLVVLDAMMPKVSGFDVLDILRNTPETMNVRVIMLTALSQPKDKQRADALGRIGGGQADDRQLDHSSLRLAIVQRRQGIGTVEAGLVGMRAGLPVQAGCRRPIQGGRRGATGGSRPGHQQG